MSDPETPAAAEAALVRRRLTQLEWAGLGALMVVLLVLALGLGGRFAVLTPWGRDIVGGFVNGKELGRYGRINVYGLRGDVWGDFTLDRVTVTDSKGAWAEGRNIHVVWNPLSLFARRFSADQVVAGQIRLIRQPLLKPDTTPPGPLPLSIRIKHFAAALDLEGGFSGTYGRWTLGGGADVERDGDKAMEIAARSVTRPGDYATLSFKLAKAGGLNLHARALEARGGPIAGSLGFAHDQAFVINADATGKPDTGQIHAVVQSGRFTPLWADGQWTPKGGRAGGRIVFAGSTLLDPLARRLGPEARFGFGARQRKDRRWDTAWVVLADNLSARAQGPVDPASESSKEGLALTLDTPAIGRLLNLGLGGGGHYSGLLSGDPSAWRTKGQATLQRPTYNGYSLASLSGPLTVSSAKGRLDIDADARGQGGGGSSFIARLLGAAPAAQAHVAQLADGRLLIERFGLEGSGLKASGTGSRGLLGGLSFEGHATLAAWALHPGATGDASGSFHASQAAGNKPWAIALDARGEKFVTGLGQLDRLVGASPHLVANGALDGHGQIAVDHAVLTGAAGQVNGKGLIGLDGSLKLLLDWTAKGPFQAGPVEFAGDASGSGALTGSIGSPRADFKAHFEQIDVAQLQLTRSDVTLTFQSDPRGYDGRIALLGASAYGPARAGANFRFEGDGVRLDNLSMDAGGLKADGSLALRRGSPSSANLTFAAGPGAFLATGSASGVVKITDGPKDALAALDVSGSNLQLRGSTWVFNSLRLKGQGTLARLPFTLSADVGGATPVKFDGTGAFSRVGNSEALSLDGAGQIRSAAYKTLSPLTATFSPSGQTLKADLSIGSGRLTADARQTTEGFDAKAQLVGVDIGAFDRDLGGRVDGSLTLAGRGKSLSGELDTRLTGVRTRLASKKLAVDGTLKAVLAGERLHIDAQAADQGAQAGAVRASTSLDLPVVASAAPLHLAIARDRPLSGRYAISGEVQPIWDLFWGGDRSLAGLVDSQGSIAGTFNAPLLAGKGTLRSGKFDDSATGLALRNLSIDADFDRNTVVFRDFSAQDGKGGQAVGDGRIDLRNGGASSFEVRLTRFQLIDNDQAVARASGPVTVTRAADGKLKLTGQLNVDRADIAPKLTTHPGVVDMDVVEINAPAGRKQFRAAPHGPGVALDVTLKARNNVFVKGRGLNVEFSLDAHVGGTSSNPELNGSAHIVRGDYDFAGKRFEFDERGSIALSTRPEDIALNLRAVREDPSLTAVLQVRGTAARPTITLTSEPALPQDEILSQVLFGASASQLSPIEAAQLASAVASLAGGGGFDVVGNLREFAGLDRLVFGGDQASGLTVAGGKYVSDRVYLELIGGGRDGEAVEVQWRIKKSLSLISRLSGQGGAKLSIRWRKDLREGDRGAAAWRAPTCH